MYRIGYFDLKNKYNDLNQGGGACIINPQFCGKSNQYFDTTKDMCCIDKTCTEGCFYKLQNIPLFEPIMCQKYTSPQLSDKSIKISPHRKLVSTPMGDILVPKRVEIKTTDGIQKFSKPTYLNNGAYGYIVQYFNKKKYNDAIVVKYGRIRDDIMAYKLIKGTECENLIIQTAVASNGTDEYMIMESANGSLLKMVPYTKKDNDISILIILNIIRQITLMFKCLAERDLYYTDIKLENILYGCIDEHHVKVILGDIGSAVKKNTSGVATFPPFDKIDTPGQLSVSEESDVVWGIGILVLLLFGIDYSNIYWRDIQQKCKEMKVDKMGEILEAYKYEKNVDEDMLYILYRHNINIIDVDVAVSELEKLMSEYKTAVKVKLNDVLDIIEQNYYKGKLNNILRMTLEYDKTKRINLQSLYSNINDTYKKIILDITKQSKDIIR